jgi:hypothetical protein
MRRISRRVRIGYNLRADSYISAHGDVTNPAVANTILAALSM